MILVNIRDTNLMSSVKEHIQIGFKPACRKAAYLNVFCKNSSQFNLIAFIFLPKIAKFVLSEDGLVNICIVEKITKFDNDIFLDFRAAGKSFAGSTIRLRMACP